jgi:cysteine dioxygenase
VAVNISITHLNIADWVKGLEAIPEREFTLENVQDYVVHHAVLPDSLKQYCFFSKGNYTRNLIFKNSVFECMTVCWEIGQKSRIHNHREQNCWMSVPIGRVRVQNYRVEQRDAAHGKCQLVPTDSFIMDPCHPAYVNPDEPVHEVINAIEYMERAVSVHIYSKPFDTCEIYRKDEGTYSDIPLFYTSEYGVLKDKLI